MAKACQSGQDGDNLSREAGEDREALRELGIAESRQGCSVYTLSRFRVNLSQILSGLGC